MRKGKHKIKSEHFLIGTIVVSVFLMLGIGYALLSQTLQINGTANITSKWKILFTSAEEKEMENATTQLKEINIVYKCRRKRDGECDNSVKRDYR